MPNRHLLFACLLLAAPLAGADLFSPAERAAIATLLEGARKAGLPDARGATLVWNDLRVRQGNAFDLPCLEPPALRLASGTWLIDGSWPVKPDVAVTVGGDPILPPDSWLADHCTFVDAEERETPGLIAELTEHLAASERQRCAPLLDAVRGHDLPADFPADAALADPRLGPLIANFLQAGRAEGDLLLAVAMLRLALVDEDPWLTPGRDRLDLGRAAAFPGMSRSPPTVDGRWLRPRQEGQVPTPDAALRRLLLWSWLDALVAQARLRDQQGPPRPDPLCRPSPEEARRAIETLFPPMESQRAAFADLLAAVTLEATTTDMRGRLQIWRNCWPDPVEVVQYGCIQFPPEPWGKRLPPINTVGRESPKTRPGPAAPFTAADLPTLIAAVDDDAPCRWVDGSRPRRVGDNALRALAGVLGGDPRLLVGIDPGAAWTDETRRETARRLAAWLAAQEPGQALAQARRALAPLLDPIDLSWLLYEAAPADRAILLDALAAGWTARLPSWLHDPDTSDPAPAKHLFNHAFVLVLRLAGDHAPLAAALDGQPLASLFRWCVAAWRIAHGHAVAPSPLPVSDQKALGAFDLALADTATLHALRPTVSRSWEPGQRFLPLGGLGHSRVPYLLHHLLPETHIRTLEDRALLVRAWLLRPVLDHPAPAPAFVADAVNRAIGAPVEASTATMGRCLSVLLAQNLIVPEPRHPPAPLPAWVADLLHAEPARRNAAQAELRALLDARLPDDDAPPAPLALP